jgi:hypothetical protein
MRVDSIDTESDYGSEVTVTTLPDCCEVRIASCQGMSPGGSGRLG